MATTTEEKLRAWTRLYSVLVMLLGLGMLAVTVLLGIAFGPRGLFADKYLLFVILPALVAIVLARFVWREKIWAILAALALAVYARFMFGNETLALNVVLTGLALAAAAIAGLHLWLKPGGERTSG